MLNTPAGNEQVDEQFLDLILDDQELLAAEFDAIIAAEWPTPPTANNPSGDACGRLRGWIHRSAADHLRGQTDPRRPRVGASGRQRSPPPRPSPPQQQPTEGR